MIFSLFTKRKTTASIIAGIFIGAACLWGLSMWQNISRQELVNILLAVAVMLAGIIAAAIIVVAVFKLAGKIVRNVFSEKDSDH